MSTAELVTVLEDATCGDDETELAASVLCMWLRRWSAGHDEKLLDALEREGIRDVNPYGECWRCSGCCFNSYEMTCDCKLRNKSVAVIEYDANLWPSYSDRFVWEEFQEIDGKRRFAIECDGNYTDHLESNPVRQWAWKTIHDDDTPPPVVNFGTIDEIRRRKGIVERVSYPDGTTETEDQRYARLMASLKRSSGK